MVIAGGSRCRAARKEELWKNRKKMVAHLLETEFLEWGTARLGNATTRRMLTGPAHVVHGMEDTEMSEQQDDLKIMLAQMRAEALKRGKDWLRTNMEESASEEALQTPGQSIEPMEEVGGPSTYRDPMEKP
ncbi:hypothetical protein NDU88_004754 [Pleurodeles waltl]|uniref:Uncharacterized protein n=1 Tax=Pleurodeles waltl TaxID=8319 RepID=A0AAV7TTG5_PLEWA|nr:hypothetical protein NDU88_004754 [Pleurodeles waltl]